VPVVSACSKERSSVETRSTFLLRFQEPCQAGDDASLGTATETRMREERDQDHHGWVATEDVKVIRANIRDIERTGSPNASGGPTGAGTAASSLGTRTETKSREEGDQDRSNLSMSTATKTSTREEQDADVGHSGYYVLPQLV
jgi:hypothetical protein